MTAVGVFAANLLANPSGALNGVASGTVWCGVQCCILLGGRAAAHLRLLFAFFGTWLIAHLPSDVCVASCPEKGDETLTSLMCSGMG
jgi:hypothetical protein